jgi:hypothetical protein
MINLGYKEPDYSGECISESKPKKMKTAYPVLCIRDAELPFESSDVGKEFTITAKSHSKKFLNAKSRKQMEEMKRNNPMIWSFCLSIFKEKKRRKTTLK